jgi:hypothetical protein
MSALNPEARKLWLWLLHRGGTWTSQEIAVLYGGDSLEIFKLLHRMHRLELVDQFEPAKNSRYKRYGVTGTCYVPKSLCVAEVQAA